MITFESAKELAEYVRLANIGYPDPTFWMEMKVVEWGYFPYENIYDLAKPQKIRFCCQLNKPGKVYYFPSEDGFEL